jgi:5'-methylthioadenosine phosphorylase
MTASQPEQQVARIGIIGGTGFYRFFVDSECLTVDTPFGLPSAPVSVADVDGQPVAFLPRHGEHHEYLPASVPYRANLFALRSLGVRQIIAFNTVGSLQPHIRKGDFVFCDQFIDRTSGRADTIFDGDGVAHVSCADPYCERLRLQAIEAVSDLPHRFHPSATVVVIQGPRFSTRAESRWFTQMGWDLVNMTQYPEVVLARELGLCYLNLSYATDYDAGAKEIADEDMRAHQPVSEAMVLRELSLNESVIEIVLRRLISAMQAETSCECQHALSGGQLVHTPRPADATDPD